MELLLDGNNFSGGIPDFLSTSPFLLTLDVSNNQLSARIPRWMGNMSILKRIIVSNNHLEGTIPVEFCQLDLKLLDLSVNIISESIPSCFNPSRIRQVHLSKNRLRGTFPDALRNSSTLVTLDISDNFLSGSIPSWIGLSNLSYLLLTKNNFKGETPMELCKLSHLSLINLSHNNLSGRIPPCLKITTLQDVSEDYVGRLMARSFSIFSFNEPIEFPIKNVFNSYKGRIIPYISGINLSCNKLVANIPYEFGNFNKLLVLNLSHNSLRGPIPPTFVNLKQIERLNFLAHFIVSFNNLSGKTPPRIAQFGTFDESSYKENPFLCGEPLPKCADNGPSLSMPNSSTNNDEDDDLIDMGVFHISFIVSYMILLMTVVVVLYINPYRRRIWFYHVETTYFIVSFNNLSGKTPPRIAQFGTFDESSYKENPFLCGEPLPKCADNGPSLSMPNSSTNNDEDDDLIDMGGLILPGKLTKGLSHSPMQLPTKLLIQLILGLSHLELNLFKGILGVLHPSKDITHSELNLDHLGFYNFHKDF
ncbi:hypothetical protein GOBAR_AA00916 [Gossypium barbadense]|uniref:Leucine-rich repeat-containing N-terminal plant-type domain-containing protein n=1 Tax=Gossypium barbadense TaxID=3634 RepID=A0A2P5YVT9_GOSBA|nr:hypothetical protein GOBAR_AA00916 [Gossypium barbadense]